MGKQDFAALISQISAFADVFRKMRKSWCRRRDSRPSLLASHSISMKYRFLLNTRIFRIFQSFQPGQPVQWVATDFA
jgi:hypothetical protein